MMTKQAPINGYKVRGRVLIPNGTGPRKAYLLRAGYLARPVTAFWGKNANVSTLLPHLVKTEYQNLPFAWRSTFKAPGKQYRETIFHTVATYQLAKYADGGYPLAYNTADGGCLCAKCATEQTTRRDREDWPRIVGADPNWEDPALYCDNCGERIESAYAEEDVTP